MGKGPLKSMAQSIPKWGALIATVTPLLGGCFGLTRLATYDYAVDRNAVSLECGSYYYGERGKRYDFDTVLYTTQDCGKQFLNYPSPTIHISHLAFPPSPRNVAGSGIS